MLAQPGDAGQGQQAGGQVAVIGGAEIFALFLPLALAVVMAGLGLHLTLADFRRVLAVPRAVAVALAVQVLLLPPVAFGLAKAFGLPGELALGLVLLAASPGGVTANLFSHLARGDVALNISLTARFPTVGKDDIRMQVNYGNVGRYMGLRAYPDAIVNGDQIDGVDAWGASVFYRHYWTDTLRSTVAYSTSKIQDAGDYTGTTTTRYDSSFVNGFWWTVAQNIQKARTRGVEASVTVPLHERLSWTTNATRMLESKNRTTGASLLVVGNGLRLLHLVIDVEQLSAGGATVSGLRAKAAK